MILESDQVIMVCLLITMYICVCVYERNRDVFTYYHNVLLIIYCINVIL